MRMLPNGEAIPIPRPERVKGADLQAPEGEWFEDLVTRQAAAGLIDLVYWRALCAVVGGCLH
jgi:hypothetical protein